LLLLLFLLFLLLLLFKPPPPTIGIGVPVDRQHSLRCIRNAADLGDSAAHFFCIRNATNQAPLLSSISTLPPQRAIPKP
jgi:hypothetical protein